MPYSYFFRSAASVSSASCLVRRGGFIAEVRLPQPDDRVAHVHAHLRDALFQLQFLLARLQLIHRVVGLRGAVADGNGQRNSGGVIREIAAEELSQHGAGAAQEERVGNAVVVVDVARIGNAGLAVVGEGDERLQATV